MLQATEVIKDKYWIVNSKDGRKVSTLRAMESGFEFFDSRTNTKELFDSIESIDIIDCNAGDHGHPFATNFNPEINIREITQRGKYWKNGKWIETEPLSEKQEIFFPEVGYKTAYLMYHEEIESLAINIPITN